MIKQSLASATRSAEVGRSDGYAYGYGHGYHYGVCRSLLDRILRSEQPLFDLHVAYVQEGLLSINDGILEALRALVTRVTLCDPSTDVASQLATDPPNLVIVLNGLHAFPTAQADAIRAMGIPVVVWFADDPYFTDKTVEIAQHYDIVFTHEQSCVPLYESHGCKRVEYLPLGTSPILFEPRPVPISHRPDIVFIGTAFWNRVRFFDQLTRYFKDKKIMIIGGLWNRLQDYPQMANRIRLTGVGTKEAAAYYSGARIVINLHRSHDNGEHNQNALEIPGRSINPRTFEVNACGTLQLTDWRDDLPRHYVPGKEIETYATPTELADKIDYYLTHEEERHRIAVSGMQRTHTEHTYRHRLMELITRTLQYR